MGEIVITNMEVIRRQKGMTGFDVMKKAGYKSMANYSPIEKRKRITWPEIRRRISEALEVPEEILFNESGLAIRADIEISEDKESKSIKIILPQYKL